MQNPRVAAVILNYNTRHWLQQLLPSVLKTQYDNFEVIVADNHSTDDSVEFLKTEYPQLRVIQLPQNYGFAGGYNECLKQVQADYFILLNSDVEVTPNWVQPIITLMESSVDIVACQPKIKAWHNREHFEYAGAAGGFIDAFAYPFCRGRIISNIEDDKGQYDDICEVFWASGAALFIKSEKWFEAGGLDADFFAHMEEIDLCWRLKNHGYKIMVHPGAEVYHVGGATLSRQNPRKTFLNFRNCLSMMVKNMSGRELIWKLPVRVVKDYAAAVLFAVYGNFGDSKAVFKAHAQFFFHLGKWMKKRRELKAYKTHPNTVGIYPKSIVLDFFGRKKKVFSELGINCKA